MAALPDDALNALSGALKMLEARIGEVVSATNAGETAGDVTADDRQPPVKQRA